MQVCTASFCQDRKILSQLFSTRSVPMVASLSGQESLSPLSPCKQEQEFLALQSSRDTFTVTTHIKQHTCGAQNAAGVFFSMRLHRSAFVSFDHVFSPSVSPSLSSQPIMISLSTLTLPVTLTHYLTYPTCTHSVSDHSPFSLGNTPRHTRTRSHLDIRYSRASKLAATTGMTHQEREYNTH